MTETPAHTSPHWGSNTRLIIGLAVVAILGGLVIRFRGVVGPLFIALVLAYLMRPVAAFMNHSLRMSWALAVGLLYLVLFVVLIGLLAVGGVQLFQQVENLIKVIGDSLTRLPDQIASLALKKVVIGPFLLDFSRLDMIWVSQQVASAISPFLNKTVDVAVTVAAGAASFLGWAAFVLLVSYFMLVESGGPGEHMVRFHIPGYDDDIRRIRQELGLIWQAFFRGQMTVFFIAVLTYTVVFMLLGVPYAFGIALLAGLARFVPYLGPWITWTILAGVAYYEPANLLQLSPTAWAVSCVILAILIDQALDYLIVPKLIAHVLRVHPAGVLLVAFIAANLVGVVGVLVAAPALATVWLLWNYILRKLLDMDPWPDEPTNLPPLPTSRLMVRLRQLWRKRFPQHRNA